MFLQKSILAYLVDVDKLLKSTFPKPAINMNFLFYTCMNRYEVFSTGVSLSTNYSSEVELNGDGMDTDSTKKNGNDEVDVVGMFILLYHLLIFFKAN
jgi:hypothetical protein